MYLKPRNYLTWIIYFDLSISFNLQHMLLVCSAPADFNVKSWSLLLFHSLNEPQICMHLWQMLLFNFEESSLRCLISSSFCLLVCLSFFYCISSEAFILFFCIFFIPFFNSFQTNHRLTFSLVYLWNQLGSIKLVDIQVQLSAHILHLFRFLSWWYFSKTCPVSCRPTAACLMSWCPSDGGSCATHSTDTLLWWIRLFVTRLKFYKQVSHWKATHNIRAGGRSVIY